MARIELKFCTIRFQDGLRGTGLVNQPSTAPAQGDTSLTIDTVALNSLRPTKVPVGARFRIAGETTPVDHVVTARTQGAGTGTNAKQRVTVSSATGGTFTLSFGGKTTGDIAYDASAATVKAALVAMDDGYSASDWDVTGNASGPWTVEFKGLLGAAPQDALVADGASLTGEGAAVAVLGVQTGVLPVASDTTLSITFAPALGAGTYVDNAVITFKPQRLNIKIGEGNLTYTEHREYTYMNDRGELDTVRESKETPLDVKLDSVYEHITTGTGENIAPMDALKGVNGAAEWVSSSPDLCEPYCIDVLVEYNPPCAPSNRETTLFPMFRAETREMNFSAATIGLTGKCFAVEPLVYRGSDCDNV